MSQQVIEIINVAISTVPTAKGSYNIAEVTYKNKTFQDKVEAKKVMSFINKQVYETLSKATFGQVYYIDRTKNDKGYWDWTNASTTNEQQEQVPMVAPASNNPVKTPSVSPKSTYETSEERAARQVMIVRQSSISSAVALLAANGGKKNTAEEVLNIAKEFEAFVMGKHPEVVNNPESFADMPDDVPF